MVSIKHFPLLSFRIYPSFLYLAFFLFLSGFLSGCLVTVPSDALKLSPESLRVKQLQTRRFDGAVMGDIISAVAGVIQDLGYTIDETESKLGILVGSKQRSAKDAAQITTAVVITLLGGGAPPPVDDKQTIRISVVVRPLKLNQVVDSKELDPRPQPLIVRVTFQRIVWNTEREVSRRESIENPKIYRSFFSKLSKSIFLEAHKI